MASNPSVLTGTSKGTSRVRTWLIPAYPLRTLGRARRMVENRFRWHDSTDGRAPDPNSVSDRNRGMRENTVVKTDNVWFWAESRENIGRTRSAEFSRQRNSPATLPRSREHDRVYRHNGIREGWYRCWRPWPNIETLNARSQENGQGYALETG